jgi:hypothetical protein
MGHYYAWAVTGRVTGLESWSEPDFGGDSGEPTDEPGSVRIASRLVERQRFFIQQHNGQEVEMNLVDSRITLRNGHVVTAVWAARKGARHGYCVMIENHTTGMETRLPEKLREIQPPITMARTARFGLIATVPVALALLMWLLMPGAVAKENLHTFLLIGVGAIVALFAVGFIVAKLVLDYLQADDDQKIWHCAEEVAAEVRAYLRQLPPRHATNR